MPVSSYAVIPDVISSLEKVVPKRVLDLGIGNGLYGCLVRNYFHNAEIIGIEGWEKYRNKMWDVYDKIIIGVMPNAFDIIEGRFDAIIMCDVIEHFEKAQGLKVVDKMLSMLNPGGVCLISTPDIFCEQSAVEGNALEIHRSLWKPKDLQGFEPLRNEFPDKYGHYMQVYKYQN